MSCPAARTLSKVDLRWASDLARADNPFEDAVVLVVDDNEANVLLLERILSGVGVAGVHRVTDPREALGRCLQVDPDLVLLDLHMPHLDGFAVLSQMQAALPDDAYLPVIVLTGDSTTTTRERALAAGARDFLTKPFDRVEVIQRARNLLQTRSLYRAIQRENHRLEAEIHRRDELHRTQEAERRSMRDRISAVLGAGGPRMVFQPVADLGTGAIVGVEALARFDTEPLRPPDEWFAEAEVVGLGIELELSAIRAAVAQLPQLPEGVFLSMNASPITALQPEVLDLLGAAGTGSRIVLELTEHSQVADWDELVSSLDALRTVGVRTAIDDAGSGYAGLEQIVSLRPDIIKLDLHLTRGVDDDPVRRALAASLVGFSHDTGATIIAEGIETQRELEALRELGVPWGQGYLLARPGPLPVPRTVTTAATS
jgi:EAL domain-containing protein (putative c-di-GMP-specific phosphodiesterase class I)/CheY-like chemotaxis protein